MTSIYDIEDERHYINRYASYSNDLSTHFIANSNELVRSFKDFIIKKIHELVIELNDQIPDLNSRDVSVYTGISGIGLFYYNLSKSRVTQLKGLTNKSYEQSCTLITKAVSSLRNKKGSFICDDTGPLTLSVLLNLEPKNLEIVKDMGEHVVNSHDIPNEMLYGRSGYLYALLLLNKNGFNVSHKLIKKVFKSIIQSGLKLSKHRSEELGKLPPLYYEWHNKAYLGAAHGMTGILFMLLQVYLESSLSDIHNDIKNDIYNYVEPTIKYLMSFKLPSCNYPSSIGVSSKNDVLVHWCHGAPGWVYMMIAAANVFKDPFYTDRIKEIGEVIWRRGLLLKGCGLCHGSAGNGYALLAIYKFTGERIYFYRALRFAEWCTDYFKNRSREADRPYSLFEGLAGTINYLVDCLDPENARFPAFEL